LACSVGQLLLLSPAQLRKWRHREGDSFTVDICWENRWGMAGFEESFLPFGKWSGDCPGKYV